MILLDNRQDKIEISEELENNIKKMIDFTLKEEKLIIDYEVSVIFVDNNQIKKLNNEFRGIDRETDVLSFPMLEYEKGKVYKQLYTDYDFSDYDFDDGKLVLGDIALSLEKADEQSKEFGHSFQREVCYLLIHSVLHLLGYDHIDEEDKVVMRKNEEYILNKFNINR
ncbi:rRNA maturation RNase YbeY [Clostridium sp. JN-9]|uniref:rRNA maturation RNase YbeY n=1 Tax=Clostridium sp. JN-9 TaxID=2507159 RepID=UPI000FFE0DD7|nr:rRNA maturation RNase YbeY [Clostridium sp. JN-9]QAT40762.1 rRNA maturation RNase YbeY [Clostridium sp. JN-9]